MLVRIVAATLVCGMLQFASAQSTNVSTLKVRVGRPLISAGPQADDFDSPLNEIPISGGFRAFTAKPNGSNSNSTYYRDGSTEWSFGGARTAVSTLGRNSTYATCGLWLNDTAVSGSTLFGFVHAETDCDYANNGQTYKSMALYTSADNGLTWTAQGQIITSSDPPTIGKETGQGDCSHVADSSFYYLYCLNANFSDRQTLVARAPISNPNPGNWEKWLNGGWSGTGLGGAFTALNSTVPGIAGLQTKIGQSAAILTTNGDTMLIGAEHFEIVGGLLMSFSADKVNFQSVPEPLLHVDQYAYSRPSQFELIAYPSVISATDGSHNVGTHFLLAYTYSEPTVSLYPVDGSTRYLVIRDVFLTLGGASAGSPQVGVALSRWFGFTGQSGLSTASVYWTTTAAVPGSFNTFAYQGDLGYLMTKAPSAPNTVLVDCVANWPGHPDHLVTSGSCDANYTQLRTLGWVYSPNSPQPANTVPVYRCYDSGHASHFASNQQTCEGLGAVEFNGTPLGYALAN